MRDELREGSSVFDNKQVSFSKFNVAEQSYESVLSFLTQTTPHDEM